MKYQLGLILGRFQIFHKGHESIINKALALCDKVLIFIGSADKSGDFKNPFTYEMRASMIKEIYQDKVIVAPLDDLGIGNVPAWGDYVIENAKKVCGMPEVIIYGDEDKCTTWYEHYPQLEFVKVNRSDIAVSTTLLKEHMLDNDYDYFKQYVDISLWKYYADMRLTLTKYYYKKEKAATDDVSDEEILLDAFEDEE